MVARSVFERLEASGFRELKVHLTEEARAHAFAAAVPEQFTASVGYGRGERSQTGGSHASVDRSRMDRQRTCRGRLSVIPTHVVKAPPGGRRSRPLLAVGRRARACPVWPVARERVEFSQPPISHSNCSGLALLRLLTQP